MSRTSPLTCSHIPELVHVGHRQAERWAGGAHQGADGAFNAPPARAMRLGVGVSVVECWPPWQREQMSQPLPVPPQASSFINSCTRWSQSELRLWRL